MDGCAAFWGPTRPFFGGHSTHEASASYYVPTTVLLVTRVLTVIWHIAMVVYFVLDKRFMLTFLTNWSFLASLISFTALAVASFLTVTKKKRLSNKVAQVALPLHMIGAGSALYITPVYYALLGRPPFVYANVAQHGGPLLFVLMEFALGASMRFRIQEAFILVLYLLVYLVFLWIRYAVLRNRSDFSWPYEFLEFTTQSNGATVGYYVGLTLWGFVAGVLLLLCTRLVGLCGPRTDAEARADDAV